MELDDCAFPLLKGVVPTASLDEGFRGVNWALLVGSVPRKAGMERKDLLGINGKIFIGQGQAIQKNAATRRARAGRRQSLQHQLPDRHEQRARGAARPVLCHDPPGRKPRQIATRHKRPASTVTAVTQHGDLGQPFRDAISRLLQRQDQRPARATQVITGRSLAQGRVHQPPSSSAARPSSRPAALSSAASAANAVVDTVRSIVEPTAAGDWHSVCLCSDGSYGVEAGLISSFPVRSSGSRLEIVPHVPLNEFGRAKLEASVNELKEERAALTHLLPK